MSFASPIVASYELEYRKIRQQIIALVVAFSTVIWGAIFFYVQTTKSVSISMAERGTASLALAFEQSVSRTVTGIDQALLYIRRDYETHPQSFDAKNALKTALAAQGLLVHLTIIDENGFVTFSSLEMKKEKVSLSDREHFQVHKERDEDSLFISKAVFGRISNKWTLQFTRRLRKPDGSFSGVIVLAVDPFVVSEFYSAVDIGPDSVLSVIGRDGYVRASRDLSQQMINTSLSGSALFEALGHHDAATLITQNLFESRRIIASFTALPNYPLVVVVGESVDHVLTTYYEQLRQGAALGLFTTALLIWFARTVLCHFSVNTTKVLNLTVQLGEEIAERKQVAEGLRIASTDYESKVNLLISELNDRVLERTADLDQARRIQSFAAEASRGYLVSSRPDETFANLLHGIINLTESEFGFIGHVLFDSAGKPYLRTRAVTDIAWNDAARSLVGGIPNLDFRNFNTLFGHTLRTEEPVIANNPATDERAHGLPDGHPQLSSYLGVPLMFDSRMVGVVGIANRQGGYSQALFDEMEAVWAAAASILHAAEKEAERKRAMTAAESANLAKTEFLSNMSHELRTPLNAVIGFAQMLEYNLKEPLTDTQKKCVNRILKGGQHLLNLINDILDLSKIEAGRVDISFESIKLAEVIDECHSLVQSFAERKGITLTVSPCQGLSVKGDYTRLKQVLLNLLSNSIKYNRPEGSVTVQCTPLNADIALVTIADTGIGIPDNNRDMLFKPFSRLGQECSAIEGTGIGLTITKHLVELMGGGITFDSIVNQGSTFYVTLPRAATDRLDGVHVRSVSASVPPCRLIGTVLYVEDNPANIELLEMVFREMDNVRLLTAPSGELGLELARINRPDLIILDLHLSGINGFEVLEKLRKTAETRHIPVFAMTASATRHDIERGVAAGFAKYITKPFVVGDVIGAVRQVLNENRQDEEHRAQNY